MINQQLILDIHWAAGFIEGEGSFHHRWGYVTAAQKQREPLERLQRMFGGKIYYRGPRNHYVWSLGSDAGRGLMMTLYVLMSPRRQMQIRTALETWRYHRNKRTNIRLLPRNRERIKLAAASGARPSVLAKEFGVTMATATYYRRSYYLKTIPCRESATTIH